MAQVTCGPYDLEFSTLGLDTILLCCYTNSVNQPLKNKLTGNETEDEILKMMAPDNFKLVVSFLHDTGEHNGVLEGREEIEVWMQGDGFGKFDSVGQLMDTEFDWSHVRDSSPRAQADMAQKIRDILAQRAHPGKQFCAKCLDSGLHLQEAK